MARKATIGAEEARAHLPKLLERALQGKTTIITRRGKPCAAVGPVDLPPSKSRGILALRDTGKGLWGKDSALTVRELREEW